MTVADALAIAKRYGLRFELVPAGIVLVGGEHAIAEAAPQLLPASANLRAFLAEWCPATACAAVDAAAELLRSPEFPHSRRARGDEVP